MSELRCFSCGYSLYGLQSGVCPECGEPVTAAADGTATIPWARQGDRVARKYLATVALVLLNPRRLARVAWRYEPLDEHLSRRFCLISLVIGIVPAAAVLGFSWYSLSAPYAGAWDLFVMLAVALGLSLLTVHRTLRAARTSLSRGPFKRCSSIQDERGKWRALEHPVVKQIACLFDYAAGTLAVGPLIHFLLLSLVAAFVFSPFDPFDGNNEVPMLQAAAAILAGLITVSVYMVTCFRMYYHLMRYRKPGNVIDVFLLLPTAFAGFCILYFVVVPSIANILTDWLAHQFPHLVSRPI